MEDADEVASVAADLLGRHGPSVIADLREKAEIPAANGDHLSAEAWADIADTMEGCYGDIDACGIRPPKLLLSRSKMSCIGAA